MLSSILCLIPFLLLSAFFSGAETAFFSLNSLERENLKLKAHSRWKVFLQRLLSQPDSLLITIVTGNLLVNVFATDFFASAIMRELAVRLKLPSVQLFSLLSVSELFSIIVMTLLILIFGEMAPKNLAVRHLVNFANFSLLPLFLTEKLLKPFTSLFDFLQRKIMQRFSRQPLADEQFNSELLSLTLQVGYKEKMLNKFELDLFESYIEFRNKTAYDVMIPRTELQGLDLTTTLDELLRYAAQQDAQLTTPYLTIYNRDIDHIVGYLDTRDLLPWKYGLAPQPDPASLVKPFFTIPQSKPLTKLIRELREQNIELAHVVDEYGGTAGILSFHHLIEDVFDYFYTTHQTEISDRGNGWYRVPGAMDLERIEELLAMEFDTEVRTISGLLMEHLGEIPEAGSHFVFDGIEYLIIKAGKNKIISLEIRKQV